MIRARSTLQHRNGAGSKGRAGRSAVGVALLAAAALLLAPAALHAQAGTRLTVEQAMELAARQSHGVRAARAQVEEKAHRRAGVASNYLPRLGTDVSYVRSSLMDQIRIPAGALGEVPDVGFFPETDVALGGSGGALFALTTLTQPVTHGFKIREGVAIARLDEQVAETRLRGVEGQVAIGALQAFAGLLIARAEQVVARMRVETTAGRAAQAQVASAAGLQLGVAAAQARVAGLDAQQQLLAAENRVEDATHALTELLALPAGSRLELVAPAAPARDATGLADWLGRAVEANPDILEARLRLAQADRGIAAARAEFIPEVGLLAMHIGQSGVPLLPQHSFSAGIRLQWTIWDFGARRQVVGERNALRRQAEANLAMVEGRVRGEVEAAHRKLERTWLMVELAQEAEQVRGELARLLRSQASAGFVLAVAEEEAATERAQGALERLQAELAYRIAQAELMRLVGDIRY